MRQWISSASARVAPGVVTTIALLGAVIAGLGPSRPALAAQQVITSAGPLTNIYITDTLNCQVSHSGDSLFEFYPPSSQTGDCGTFVVVGGTLYGFAPFGGSAAGSASPRTAFTPVSQSAVLGSGTSADPYRIVTVVAAGTTGITLTETDSYVVGQEAYRTDVQLANAGATGQPVLMYRAGDCFLQNSDLGFGRAGPGGAIACTADQTATSRIEQWVPITGGSHYYETFYNTGWAKIGSQQPFADTCDCSVHEDNWAGLSWAVTIAASSTTTVSHLTVFSPQGIQPLTTTKTADTATAAAGTADGYTITVSNPNVTAVTVNSIFDDLPTGFTYTAGTTTGVTTTDPTVVAQHLTWTGPFTVPGSGSVSLHFGVTVSSAAGVYTDNAGADAGSVAVAPTGPTAPVTVTSAADPPITATGVPVTATEGIAFNGTVATFTDPDTNATASEYSATIDWGDGSPTSAGTVSGPTAGTFTVTGSHTYADEGVYTTTVVITDSDTASNTKTVTSTATVGDAALTSGPPVPIIATEGMAFSGTVVGSFSDANPGATAADFTATIHWGDGSPATVGVVAGPTGGPFTVSGSHTYAEEGPYTITVTVTDDGGSSATLTGTATVADAPLSGSCATPVVSGTAFAGPTATFTDQSATGTLSDFSATINWGDGSTSPGVITGGPGTAPYTVSGTHTYTTPGFYVITTTINDVGGSHVMVVCSNQTFVFPPSTAGCDIDGNGKIKAANGDKAKFTVDAEVATTATNTDDEDEDDDEDNRAAENVQTYRDLGPATPFGFLSMQTMAVTCNDHRSGSIYGVGTVDGTTPVFFIIDVRTGSRDEFERHGQNDEEGGRATYRIRLSNGYDSGQQNVRGRIDIQIEADRHHGE
jgi:hypothetical protein